MAIKTDPVSESPLLEPDKVPPLLVKSTLLPANIAVGRASASAASKRIFFIVLSPRSYSAWVFKSPTTCGSHLNEIG